MDAEDFVLGFISQEEIIGSLARILNKTTLITHFSGPDAMVDPKFKEHDFQFAIVNFLILYFEAFDF